MPNGHIGFCAMLAEGGWGIVSAGLTEIDPSSDLSNLPHERLWDDSDIPRHAAGNKAEMTKVQKGIIKDVLRGENSREQNADWLPAYFQFSAKAYTERGGVGVVERWKAVQDLFVPAL